MTETTKRLYMSNTIQSGGRKVPLWWQYIYSDGSVTAPELAGECWKEALQ